MWTISYRVYPLNVQPDLHPLLQIWIRRILELSFGPGPLGVDPREPAQTQGTS